MDWNAFFAVLTWIITGVSAIVLLFLFFVLLDDDFELDNKRSILTLITTAVITIVGFSTIAGMGWTP